MNECATRNPFNEHRHAALPLGARPPCARNHGTRLQPHMTASQSRRKTKPPCSPHTKAPTATQTVATPMTATPLAVQRWCRRAGQGRARATTYTAPTNNRADR